MEITVLPENPLKQLTWQEVITSYAKITDVSLQLLDDNSEVLFRAFLTVEEFENRLGEIFDCVLLGFSKQNQDLYAQGLAITQTSPNKLTCVQRFGSGWCKI